MLADPACSRPRAVPARATYPAGPGCTSEQRAGARHRAVGRAEASGKSWLAAAAGRSGSDRRRSYAGAAAGASFVPAEAPRRPSPAAARVGGRRGKRRTAGRGLPPLQALGRRCLTPPQRRPGRARRRAERPESRQGPRTALFGLPRLPGKLRDSEGSERTPDEMHTAPRSGRLTLSLGPALGI